MADLFVPAQCYFQARFPGMPLPNPPLKNIIIIVQLSSVERVLARHLKFTLRGSYR